MERIGFITGLITKMQVGAVRAVLCPGSSMRFPWNPSSISYVQACFYLVLIVMSFYLPTVMMQLVFLIDQADVDVVLNVTNRFCVASAMWVKLGKSEALAINE